MNRLTWFLATWSALAITSPSIHAVDWVEQASKPGPRIAPIGYSRFDQLYLDANGSYRIPYPFEALVADLEKRLDNGDQAAVRHVFIPLGRSLQREAPMPDYFRFPREVIAVEGEPVVRTGQAGLVMEYRLFIAHQPKTRTLEVISYNDDAGRFEFQLVENYAKDRGARVQPANRLMCMSCHHNAAPIFARRPWRETSFNVDIARRLSAALPQRFPSMIDLVKIDAGVIDILSERANYLSVAQAVWRKGCTSKRCRKQLLRAALQYRLSGKSHFERDTLEFRRDYFAELSHNWKHHWPAGLALPASRLSDRDPLSEDADNIAHDPLQPRPAQASWHEVDSILAEGIVFRLAGFFTQGDIERLDRRLIAIHENNPAADYHHSSNCRLRQASEGKYLLKCGAGAGIDQLEAEIEFEFANAQITSMDFRSLRLPRDTDLLQPRVIEFSQSQGLLDMTPKHRSGLSQRLANGDRLESMQLSWQGELLQSNSRLELRIAPESVILDAALTQMLDIEYSSSLSARPIRRQAILQDLMPLLGMQDPGWWSTVANIPGREPALTANIEGELALLQPYCAPCHAENRRHPPGFLAGQDILARVTRCAPRILRRLRAWQNQNGSALTPMPPPASIEYSGSSASDWPNSDHYQSLVDSIEGLLPESGKTAWRDQVYADLPSCLPG